MAGKIIVSGGAGFIGSNLIEKLLEKEKFEITVIDNFSTGYMENLEAVKDRIELIKADACSYNEIKNAFFDVKYVFHLAAFSYVGESIRKPFEYNKNNMDSLINVLNASKENSAEKVIFPSTCVVYGEAEKIPIPESEALKPNTPYGLTKQAGEFYCRFFTEVYGLDTVCLRIFNAYGMRMQSRVLSIFADLMIHNKQPFLSGNGEQSRDFVFIDDIVNGLIKAMEAGKKSKGKSYNIGTGKGTSLNELIEKINLVLGKNIKAVHKETAEGEINEIIADTSLAEKELGFKAETDLDSGLKKTIEWLEKKDLKQSQKSYI